jgi:single-strand DNA-binding protein
MTSLNKVLVMGHLTRDPELRHTAGGNSVVSLRMAVNRSYTGKDGEKKEEVAFFTVVAWGRLAEVCSEYLKKGSPLLAEGRLQSHSWETPDKQKRSSVEVVATNIHFLGRKEEKAAATAAAFEEEVPENGNGVPAEEPDEAAATIPF